MVDGGLWPREVARHGADWRHGAVSHLLLMEGHLTRNTCMDTVLMKLVRAIGILDIDSWL